ncbi:hypothetical protein ACIQUD_32030 [Streptomyces globisporus]|uniref:hypothetical protein n=1 Tax=Streptomyces globisporus TaxID=1908 RepID=UPI0037FB3511
MSEATTRIGAVAFGVLVVGSGAYEFDRRGVGSLLARHLVQMTAASELPVPVERIALVANLPGRPCGAGLCATEVPAIAPWAVDGGQGL